MTGQRNPHQGIIRRPRLDFEDGFVMIPTEWARDGRIKPAARGVLLWLMSHREGFETGVAQLAKENGTGRDAARTIVTDLEHAGYLERVLVRGSAGQYEATEWRLLDPFAIGRQQLRGLGAHETPTAGYQQDEPENPCSEPAPENPAPDNPAPDNPAPVNPTTKEDYLQEDSLTKNSLASGSDRARDEAPGSTFTDAEKTAFAAGIDRPAYGVQPAPKLPRLADIPTPGRRHLEPRPADVEAAIAVAVALTCPAGFGIGANARHWFPGDLTGCARCGTEALDLIQEIHP